VGCVLGTAEPGLDQREAGLHEDDEHRADDDPQQVGLLAEAGDGLGRVDLLRAGDAGHGQDQGAGDGDPDPCLPPQRHAGSRFVTSANGHGCVFLCSTFETQVGRRCLTCA
jgi:hypothetical protein